MTAILKCKMPKITNFMKLLWATFTIMIALLGQTEAMQNRIATRRAMIFSQQAEEAATTGDLEGTKAAFAQIESLHNSPYPVLKAAIASVEVQQILQRTIQTVAELHLKAAEVAQGIGEDEKAKISFKQMEDVLQNLPVFIKGPINLSEQLQKRADVLVRNITGKADEEARKNDEEEQARRNRAREEQEAVKKEQ